MEKQRQRIVSKTAIEIISLLFIFLFMYAAITKLMDYQKFVVQLGQSPMLTRWAGAIGWAIPAVEVGLSILLIFNPTQKAALYGSLNLMVMFTAYIIIILNFSPQIPCSCGGVLDRLGWTEHLIFNSAFIVLAIVGILLHDKSTFINARYVMSSPELS